MSDIHELQYTLSMISLCSLDQNGGTLVPPPIREELKQIRDNVTKQILIILNQDILLPQEIKKTLISQVTQPPLHPVLWRELHKELEVLTTKLQLLQNLSGTPTPSSTEINSKTTSPTPSIKGRNSKTTSPTPKVTQRAKDVPPFMHEEANTPPLVLTLPSPLAELASNIQQSLVNLTNTIQVEYGFRSPRFEITSKPDTTSYMLHFKSLLIGHGTLDPNLCFALAPEEAQNEEILVAEPAYGKKGLWLPRGEEKEGFRIIETQLILESHIHELVIQNVHLIFDWNSFNDIIANLEQEHGPLLKKIIPQILSRKQLFEIYTTLLAEDIPLRKHETILKTLYAFRSKKMGVQVLTEQIRRHIFDPLRLDSEYRCCTISKPLEKILRQGLVRTNLKQSFRIDEPILERLVETISELSNQCQHMMIIIVPPPLRSALQALVHPHRLSNLRVLSSDDIEPQPERNYATIALNEFTLT